MSAAVTTVMDRCGSITGLEDHKDRDQPVCDKCRAAHGEWQREYRKQVYLQRGPMLIPSIGTQRRIRALCRMGWTQGHIAEFLGMKASMSIGNILRRPRVHRHTATRIAVLYDRLSMHHGPSAITAARAARLEWAPPLAWEDIDNPDDIPQTPEQARRERQQAARERQREQKRKPEVRARINAQNYQRRKARRGQQQEQESVA